MSWSRGGGGTGGTEGARIALRAPGWTELNPSPGSWNPQGVSEGNFAFNYSWWHFGFVLKATSEPSLVSQLLCSECEEFGQQGLRTRQGLCHSPAGMNHSSHGHEEYPNPTIFPSKRKLTLKLSSSSKSPPLWLSFGTVSKIHHWKEITCNPCFHKLHWNVHSPINAISLQGGEWLHRNTQQLQSLTFS